jgi:hypothetical protein
MDESGKVTLYPDVPKPNRYGLPDAAHIPNAGHLSSVPVTIIAPGPKGRPHWEEKEGLVIAVNSAITIDVDPVMWFIADGNAPGLTWFKRGMDASMKSTIRVFSEAIHQRSDYKGDYTFWLAPSHFDTDADMVSFMQEPYRVDPDFFRPTETVTGIAIDFAVRYGAKQINLIGVDMEGGYFDDPPGLNRDVINSYNRDCLQKEIDYFKARGIEFRALSPTRLDV